MKFSTPLRYPGGKGRLTNYVADFLDINDIKNGCYAEPFCGGAGIALSLLYAERVQCVYLNDADRSVYAFWHSAIYENERLCQRVHDTPINMDVWQCMKLVQQASETADLLDLGFSTFFLNRTNRSGILKGGVIGGKMQTGKWKIDARFAKETLLKRIEMLAYYSNDVRVSNLDVIDFIEDMTPDMPKNTLIYFDPPYFNKGKGLYRNYFVGDDHARLAKKIQSNVRQPWIVSYDNVPEISAHYVDCRKEVFSLNYSANTHFRGSELMVFKDELVSPSQVYTSRAMLA